MAVGWGWGVEGSCSLTYLTRNNSRKTLESQQGDKDSGEPEKTEALQGRHVSPMMYSVMAARKPVTNL